MKRALCALLALLIAAGSLTLGGCGKHVKFKGTASCERVDEIEVSFIYNPEVPNAYDFEFDMDANDAHYIEGVDYPEGAAAITPSFRGNIQAASAEMRPDDGIDFIERGGYYLEIVELNEEYALGYLCYVTPNNMDGAGKVNFGIMDIVFTRNGNDKYIPDNWQELLHAYEPSDEFPAEYDDSDLRRYISIALSNGFEAAAEEYAPGKCGWKMEQYAAAIAADDSEAILDRVAASVWLIDGGTLDEQALADCYLGVLALKKQCADDAELLSLYKLLMRSVNTEEYSEAFASHPSYIELIAAYAIRGSGGAIAALEAIMTDPNPAVASALPGGYEIDALCSAIAESCTEAEAAPIIHRGLELGVEIDGLLAAVIPCLDIADGIALVDEAVAAGALDVATDGSSIYAAFLNKLLLAEDANALLTELNAVRTCMTGAATGQSSIKFELMYALITADARFDVARYAEMDTAQSLIAPPDGKILPVYVGGSDDLVALPSMLTAWYGALDERLSLPDSVIPASVEDIDILLLLDSRDVFYGTYTSGNATAKAYSTVTYLCAYDFETGEPLGCIGSISNDPPPSFTGYSGSEYHMPVDYFSAFELLCSLYE